LIRSLLLFHFIFKKTWGINLKKNLEQIKLKLFNTYNIIKHRNKIHILLTNITKIWTKNVDTSTLSQAWRSLTLNESKNFRKRVFVEAGKINKIKNLTRSKMYVRHTFCFQIGVTPSSSYGTKTLFEIKRNRSFFTPI